MQEIFAAIKKYTDSLCDSVSLADDHENPNYEILELKKILSCILFLSLCALLGSLTPYIFAYLFNNWIPFITPEQIQSIVNDHYIKDAHYHLEENKDKLFFGSLKALPFAFTFLFFSIYVTKAKENTWWLSSIALYGIGISVALLIIFIQGTTHFDLTIPLLGVFLSLFLGVFLYKLIQLKKISLEKLPIYFAAFFPIWVILSSVTIIRSIFGLPPRSIADTGFDSLAFVVIFFLSMVLVFTFQSLEKHVGQPRPKWIKWRFAHVIIFNTLALFIYLGSTANNNKE